MNSQEIQPNLHQISCQCCDAPVLLSFESFDINANQLLLCFSCMQDYCTVISLVRASNLPTRNTIDKLKKYPSDVPLSAINTYISYYKRQNNKQKISQEEEEIDDLF
jgi:hypothetical protein